MAKRKFNDIWINQSELGKRFGISAIAVGKILANNDLKDGRFATEKAISNGIAKSTPLKNGTPFFMWNAEKLEPIIAAKHTRLTKDRLVINEIKETMRDAQEMFRRGEDKLGCLAIDVLHDEYKGDIRIKCAAFELEMESSDFNSWMVEFRGRANCDYNGTKDMLTKYHPEYLDRFEKLIALC